MVDDNTQRPRDPDGPQDPVPEPASWEGRVAIAPGPGGYAYVPGDIIVPEADAQRADALLTGLFPGPNSRGRVRLENQGGYYSRMSEVPDTLLAIRHLRGYGMQAQPNHVFFAHCADACCGPHPSVRGQGGAGVHAAAPTPVYASFVQGAPVYASPVHASPVYASPVYASPVYASPVYASGTAYAQTGTRRTSARSVSVADAATLSGKLTGMTGPGPAKNVVADVVVLDTGFLHQAHCPSELEHLSQNGLVYSGDNVWDVPVPAPGKDIYPAAGHGSFIGVLIENVAPGVRVQVRKVLTPMGDGNEVEISTAIENLPPAPEKKGAILSLSFGGHVLTHETLLAAAIRTAQAKGWVVVASAGNDGVCQPTYPAAFPDVVSVGAIGPHGPAPFTNFGPWVRACAPGVDLVSSFFSGIDGPELPNDGYDVDNFEGWAKWSGTSFSGPIVAGVLAQHMRTYGVTAAQAVARVIDDPALLRLADLGTVINVV
jgi:hypothetical protein